MGWRPVLDNAGQLWKSRQSKSLVAWMPDGSGLLVQGRRMILDSRLYTLSDAAGEPVFLPQVPRNVVAIHGEPGREYMVLGWDTSGDEQYRLYRWDLGDSRLMVVQGANDPRVPVNESRQLVERVRDNDPDIAYIEGANEGHGFRHPWNSFYAGLAQQEMTRECLLEG